MPGGAFLNFFDFVDYTYSASKAKLTNRREIFLNFTISTRIMVTTRIVNV